MRKLIFTSVALATLALGPASADVIIVPEVDTWVMEQPDSDSVTIEGDIAIGAPLPDNVEIVEVPEHDEFSYVVVNKKRVLVDRRTRKVVKIY